MKNSRLVYSTAGVSHCKRCGMVASVCRCGSDSQVASIQGPVRISRSSKGRGGKIVTLVTGIALDETGLKKLAKEFKSLCGSGGTVRDGVIEIQGDHREKLLMRLSKDFKDVKIAGS